jgi:hypothetical protein
MLGLSEEKGHAQNASKAISQLRTEVVLYCPGISEGGMWVMLGRQWVSWGFSGQVQVMPRRQAATIDVLLFRSKRAPSTEQSPPHLRLCCDSKCPDACTCLIWHMHVSKEALSTPAVVFTTSSPNMTGNEKDPPSHLNT